MLKIPHCGKPRNVSGHCTKTTPKQQTAQMKQIIVILSLIIFTLTSCNENKAETKKTVEIVATDEFALNDYSDLNEPINYTKELDLYWLLDLEENANKKAGFISLSDVYPLSEHIDSLAIPNLENVNKDSLQYFKLDSSYRNRFLSKTKISETDSLFIFDYSTDVQLSFPIKKLNVVAYLNTYMDINDCPCNQYDYMIGFEVTKNNLNGLGNYYSDALVFIGKENPFTQGQMKPIVWQKVKAEKFPLGRSNLTEMQKKYKHNNAIKGQAYLYETDSYQIFIQDYTEPNNLMVQDRHLIVIDKKSGNVVNETMFSNSEGTMLAPLNFGINNTNYPDLKEQWIGKLFKGKPEVLFGFQWVSFGCPSIIFVNSQDKYVQINCDNRH